MKSIKPRRNHAINKSIYSKLFFSVIGIVFLCFLSFAALLFTLINEYVVTDKEKQLYNNAKKISEMTTVLIENYSSPVEYSYKTYLGIYNEGSNSDMIVINSAGKVIYTTVTKKDLLSDTSIGAEYSNAVLGGSVYKNMTTFGNIFPQGTYVVGVPVYGDDRQVIGGVFVASTVPLNYFLDEIKGYYLSAALFMLLVCFSLTYIVANKIIGPIQKMSMAAKSFAKGNFDVRVPVTSRDEVGELAISFNNMASSLNSLDKMRNDFIANVSHDLRTPMTVIAGFIDGILDETIEKDKQRYYLGIVKDEILRLSRLVKNLLDIAKIEAGEMELNIVEFNICEMMSKILLSFEGPISKKDINVNVDFLPSRIDVLSDYDSIFQVIYNLCDNAVKFTNEKGYINITILKQNDKARITIRNSGEGISPDEMPRLFEKFYKSDRSRGLDKRGTGLGLYISQNIINRHGGNIDVKSVSGEYTEFSFCLPLASK